MAIQHFKFDPKNGNNCFPVRTTDLKPFQNALQTSGSHRFGSGRGNGRLHAGVDLYAANGVEVYAVNSGKIVRCAPFYRNTWAVEIEHENFVVRYCEINPICQFTPGEEVISGDLLGTVLKIDGINQAMLHFEIYNKACKGQLTDLNNPPYFRRKDLLNPEEYIKWLIS